MKRVLLCFLVVTACASNKSPAPRKTEVRGVVTLDPSVLDAGPCKGRLVMSWTTEEEARGSSSMMQMVEQMLRYRVIDDVDLCAPGARAPYALEVPAGRILTHAVLDVDRLFWRAMLQGDVAGTRLGHATAPVDVADGTTGALDVVLNKAQQGVDHAASCSGERLAEFVVDAPEVVGRVGNPRDRHFCVALPRSYDTSPSRRYPVVFILPGFVGNHVTRFRHTKAHLTADAFAQELGVEAILVGVDTSTRLGSTYFVDGALHGAWESFALRMVKELDAKYRTIPAPSSRAVMGQSTGGFNALSLAFRHPDVFGVVVSSSPDWPDLDDGMLEADHRHMLPWLRRWMATDDALGADGQTVSWAADWSPSSHPRGFDWPIDFSTGEVIPDVWKRWVAQSPSAILKAHPERIKPLDGNILLWAGDQDEFGLHLGVRTLSRQLTQAGIAHEHLEVPGAGHGMTTERFAGQLKWALQHLAR